MSLTDKHIVETYAKILKGLDASSKKMLIEELTKSLGEESVPNEDRFYQSFGAFASDKSAEDIIKEIRDSRTFIRKEIEF